MRSTLVAALVSCADSPHRSQARRFVQGLSADELQFIAAFLGACMLDAGDTACASRDLIARYQQSAPSADQEHKMILLREYLSRTGAPQSSLFR